MRNARKTVKILGPKATQTTEIPRAELAPGMLAARIHGRPDLGVVFIPQGELRLSPRLRSSLPPDFIQLARAVHELVREFITWDNFLEGFFREAHPASELREWTKIASIFAVASEQDRDPKTRSELYRLCLEMSLNGSAAHETFQLSQVSRRRAKAIDRLFALWTPLRAEKFWGDRFDFSKLEPLLAAEGSASEPRMPQGFAAVELFDSPNREELSEPGNKLPHYRALYDADVVIGAGIGDESAELFWGRELAQAHVDANIPLHALVLNVEVTTEEDRSALAATIGIVKTTEAEAQGLPQDEKAA